MRRRRLPAVVALLAAGVAVVVVGPFGGDERAHTARLEVADATGLVDKSDVKVDGIVVGSVAAPTVTTRDTAMVVLRLDDSVIVGSGASASIRSANLLGEKYVALRLGDRSRPLPDGSLLRTDAAPVQLDDVLNMLDTPTRARLRIFLNEAGIALLGRGADLNGLLAELPGSLAATTRLVDQIASENRALGTLVEHVDRFATTTARRRGDLERLVVGAQRALAVTARKQRELGATLDEAPGALEQLDASLGRLIRLAQPLKPNARALAAAAAPLTETLRALPPFERAAAPSLRAVTATAPALERLGRSATGPVRRLRPALAGLAQLAATAQPLTRALDEGSGLRNLLRYLDGFGAATSHADGLGHYIRIHVKVDKTLVTSLIGALTEPVRPAKRRGSGRRRPATAAPAATPAPPAPTPATTPSPLPQLQLPKVQLPDLKGALPQITQTLQDDLQGLLDYLVAP